MRKATPTRRATASIHRTFRAPSCKHLALLALTALVFAGCTKPKTAEDDDEPAAKPNAMEEEFHKQSKPTAPVIAPGTTEAAPGATAAAAPAQWSQSAIYPMPLRPWLPPADTLEIARTLPGDIRIATSAPSLLMDTPLPPPNVSAPDRLMLPAPALAQTPGPDSTLVTVFVATSPLPEMRGRQPAWDRPQLSTDPTLEMSRALPLDPPLGLRETTPSFVRVNLPAPAAQNLLANLGTPAPEIVAPIVPNTRPAIGLLEVPAQK